MFRRAPSHDFRRIKTTRNYKNKNDDDNRPKSSRFATKPSRTTNNGNKLNTIKDDENDKNNNNDDNNDNNNNNNNNDENVKIKKK